MTRARAAHPPPAPPTARHIWQIAVAMYRHRHNRDVLTLRGPMDASAVVGPGPVRTQPGRFEATNPSVQPQINPPVDPSSANPSRLYPLGHNRPDDGARPSAR